MPSNYISGIITIGSLPLGGHHPIRVQSMTNTNTRDTDATIAQSIRLVNAGCEMVRITAQGITEAKNLANIKKGLLSHGINVPLIADIHFNPGAAEIAAALVEKVRINPGNYTDSHKPGISFTNREYEDELERISKRLHPLLEICKHNGTAIRIGTNHGSLSQRIMDRYGDTPEGMAESALEFGRICLDYGFRNVIFSMKSSNVRVMVESTRLLVQKMMTEGMNFPVHLGVTEAGNGEDGIIKSAAGTGTLLEEGIGDTIRVSLTGDPVTEIPVALAITERYNEQRKNFNLKVKSPAFNKQHPGRETIPVAGIGGTNPIGVLTEKNGKSCLVDENFSTLVTLENHDLQHLVIAEGNAYEITTFLGSIEKTELKPLVLKNNYSTADLLRFQIDSAIDFGYHLINGTGNAIWPVAPKLNPEIVNHTAFAILQATRARITRTEFISCPSCGRTLFDIENSLQQVKTATQHLKGLKIAVMGCIVNGPGEMADADFGYVGAGPGRITLYKGKEVAYKNIPQTEAISRLLELIKQSGYWTEP